MFPSLRSSERHSQNSRSSPSQTRGQVGIETLILFTAVLLIAATTAAVFLQTTGVLEAQSDSTSESIVQQSMSQLATVAEVGVVQPVSGSDVITEIRLILKLERDSQPINLNEMLLNVQRENTASTFSYTNKSQPEQSTSFVVDPIRDRDGTAPRLTRSDDRFAIMIVTNSLEPGTSLAIQFVLPSGTTQRLQLQVPLSLEDTSTVRL